MMTMEKLKEYRLKMEREVAAMIVTRPDLTLSEIGGMYGVDDNAVQYIMRKHGVAARTPGRKKGKKLVR